MHTKHNYSSKWKEARSVSIFWLRKISSLVERWVSLSLFPQMELEKVVCCESYMVEHIESISVSIPVSISIVLVMIRSRSIVRVFVWSDRK